MSVEEAQTNADNFKKYYLKENINKINQIISVYKIHILRKKIKN